MIDLQSHSTVSDGQLDAGGRRPRRRRGGDRGDGAHRPRRGRRRAPRRRRRPRSWGSSTCPRSRCRASTATRRTSTSAATGSTSSGSSPPATAPSRSASTAPRRSSRDLNAHGVEVTFEDAVAKAGRRRRDRPPAHRQGRRRGPGPRAVLRGVPGARARRRSSRASGRAPRRRFAMIHDAGGVAVVAHPYWDVQEPDQVRDLVESLVRDVGARRDRDLLPAAHGRADEALPRALRGVRIWSRPPPRTSTAPPTRPSAAGAPTTPTASASPRFRLSPASRVRG